MTEGWVERVTRIEFEYSPGRGDDRYLGDRSAFDVFVEFRGAGGRPGFIGLEVKYHEDLDDTPGRHRERYEEVARKMGAFQPEALLALQQKPLQQLWRDHLLAGSLLQADADTYAHGRFVLLFPRDNAACAGAAFLYRQCLRPGDASFDAWTLEEFTTALREVGAGDWLDAFVARYLDFVGLEGLLPGADGLDDRPPGGGVMRESGAGPRQVLEVGADGGSLKLLVNEEEPPRYAARVNDQALLFIGQGPEHEEQCDWTDWETAVAALSRFPWRRLYPVHVDPAYCASVWKLVQAEAQHLDPDELERWARLCGMSPDASR